MLKPAAHHFLEERLAAAFATEFSSLEISERMSLRKTWDQSDEIASNLLNLIEKLYLPTGGICTYDATGIAARPSGMRPSAPNDREVLIHPH
jgi:hypothetical protein